MDLPEIDEQAYRLGKQAFEAGASLRSILEACRAAPPIDEVRTFSSAVGFFDAVLDHLRGINTPSKAV